MIILVNEFSASASEILAAALQDYNRAVVLGRNKPMERTVQNIIDLANVIQETHGDLGLKDYYRYVLLSKRGSTN